MKQLIPEKQTSNKGGADSFTKMTMPKPAKTAIAAATLFAAVVLAVLCFFPGNKGHAAADVTYTDSYSNSGDFTTFQAAAAAEADAIEKAVEEKDPETGEVKTVKARGKVFRKQPGSAFHPAW